MQDGWVHINSVYGVRVFVCEPLAGSIDCPSISLANSVTSSSATADKMSSVQAIWDKFGVR